MITLSCFRQHFRFIVDNIQKRQHRLSSFWLVFPQNVRFVDMPLWIMLIALCITLFLGLAACGFQFTTLTGRSSRNALTFPAAIRMSLALASAVDQAIWGVIMQFLAASSGF